MNKTLPDTALHSNYLVGLFPKLKEKKAQSFTMIIFTCFAVIIFSLFAISPTITTIVELKKQIEDGKFVEQQLTQKIKNLASLSQQYAEINPDIMYALLAVPKTPSVPLFVGKIQAVAGNNSVSLTRMQTFSVEVSNSSLLQTANSFAFSLDATGSDGNIFNFIHDLSNFDRIITIESITIHQSSQGTSLYDLTLKGTAYFQTL